MQRNFWRLLDIWSLATYAASQDLPVLLANLEKLDTFVDRKDFAEKHFKHLSSGSSRLIYLTNKNTVIKLAKNEKGFAQNRAEANPKMKSKFLNKILSHSKDYLWIEVPKLNKITPKDFKKLTDFDFEDFGEALSFALKKVSDDSSDKPKNYEKISKSQLFKELVRIGKEFKVLPGDMERISSYGEKDNIPILLDAGLTREIYDKFYDKPDTK